MINLLILCTMILGEAYASPSNKISYDSKELSSFEIREIPASLLKKFQQTELLYLQAVNSDSKVIGTYKKYKDSLRFTPSFKLSKTRKIYLHYLECKDKSCQEVVRKRKLLKFDKIYNKELKVVASFPQGKLLPENLLRFHFDFNRSVPYHTVELSDFKILNEKDEEIKNFQLSLKEPLWSKDRKRLTFYFDPGRIKSGVGSNLIAGKPLHQGQNIKVELNYKNRNIFRKSFKIASSFKEIKSPNDWEIKNITIDRNEKLAFFCDCHLSVYSLENHLKIVNKDGIVVKGQFEYLESGSLVFSSANKINFKKSSYELIIEVRAFCWTLTS